MSAGTTSAMTFSPWRSRNQWLTDVFWLPIAQPVNVPRSRWWLGVYGIHQTFHIVARKCRPKSGNRQNSFGQKFNVNAPDIKLHYNDYYYLLFVVPVFSPTSGAPEWEIHDGVIDGSLRLPFHRHMKRLLAHNGNGWMEFVLNRAKLSLALPWSVLTISCFFEILWSDSRWRRP